MKLFLSKLHYKNINELDFFEAMVLKVLFGFSVFYKLVVQFRNYLYDENLIKSYCPHALTISVGNLTTGGVGKTPVVAEIANTFSQKGKIVSILSRGYGAALDNKEPNIISDGKNIFYSSEKGGDEPVFLAENCPNVSVVTCASRVKAAKIAEKNFNADVLLLDDAFQHRKLGRHINLALVDNKNRFGNELLLPSGPLREPLENIKRADKIILVNKSSDDENALRYCEELENRFHKKVFLCKMVPDKTYNILTNKELEKDSRVLAFSAIGQPSEFYEFVKKDYNLAVTVDFEDHHFYDESNIKELFEIASKESITKLVTTEKDAVKIKKILSKYKTEIEIYALKLKAFLDVEEICRD
ncbi:MAG: tetraacyldisaccharide 4'-kinase [Candidatus Gastranaerophilales bacterium]|nr:tetraacyldisaccharide 4'-kinase [Candidatus Gastranaerophilales bacterium]